MGEPFTLCSVVLWGILSVVRAQSVFLFSTGGVATAAVYVRLLCCPMARGQKCNICIIVVTMGATPVYVMHATALVVTCIVFPFSERNTKNG